MLNHFRQTEAGAQGNAGAIADFLRPYTSQLAQNGSNSLWGTEGSGGSFGDYMDRIKNAQNGVPGNYAEADLSKIPGLQESIGNQKNLQNLGWQSLDPLMGLINGRGGTDQGNASINQLMNLANGGQQGYGGMNALGQTLVGNSGKTDLTEALKNYGSTTLNQAGYNPTLTALNAMGANAANNPMTSQMNQLWGSLGAGMNGVNGVGGLTQTGAAAEGQGLQTLLGRGANAATDYGSRIGAGIVGTNPLLGMNQVTSMARNQAATQAHNQAENASRIAYSRGGGPGATVANGSTNQALGDFEDQALQNQSSAVNQAMLNQQGLQAQQWGQGSQLLQGMQGAQNQAYGTAAGLVPNLENAATGRFSTVLGAGNNVIGNSNQREATGLGAIQGAANTAAGREGQAYGALNNSGSLQGQNMNTGANILNQMFGNQLNAYQGANQIQGTQNAAAQGASSNYNNLLQGLYGNANNVSGNQMAGANTALGFTKAQQDALNALLQNQFQGMNLSQGTTNQNNTLLTQQQGQWMDLLKQAMQSQGQTVGGLPNVNPTAGLSAISGLAGGILGAI